MKTALKALPLLAALVLGGCAVKKVPPTQTYTLPPPALQSPSKTAQKPLFDTLKVSVTDPSRLGLSTAIYYLRGERLQPYAYNRWAQTPAAMVEKAALLALQNERIARHVLTGASRGRSDHLLELSLLDFTQRFGDEGSRGRVLLQATLIDAKSREVLKSKLFEATAPAPTDDAAGGVAALGSATKKVMEALTEWLRGD
ncbi:ABC-type transport auxiliary lipoprotein family protein [Hydrogenimonas sp.]